jgi:uncharacterized protein (TIGR00251 family)
VRKPLIDERDGRIRFPVHVQPRASRTEISGLHGDSIKVRLTAAPVDGAANALLVEFLAKVLGVTRGAVRIVAGEPSRRKVVEVVGVRPEQICRLVTDASTR